VRALEMGKEGRFMITRHKVSPIILLVVLAAACGSSPASPVPANVRGQPTDRPGERATAVEATRAPVTAAAPSAPTGTPAAEPTVAPVSAQLSSAPLFYNLPPAVLTTATGLYASPNRGDLIAQASIPAGQTVYVMGRNASSSHLRVVWNTGVGWVPTSFTDFNGAKDKMAALPVFTREPPGCAIPLTTQFGLGSQWVSRDQQRIAVVVDLFRSRFGEFPTSTLALVVNGKEVETSKRQIVEQGQFSLKDVVFTLPADMQPNDTLGYLLQTSSDEPLTFMATIFSVPNDCKWKLD
jgi:hypothetical protein